MEQVIRIFMSHAEAEAADRAFYLSLSSEQRMEMLLELNRRGGHDALQHQKRLLASFNAAKVEFLVAGAHALAWHARPRFTGDLDLFIRPTPENARRVLQALASFGFASIALTENDLVRKDAVIQLGFAPNRIDLLTDLTGLTFDDAWQHRVQGTLDEHPVAYLSREDLIRNKRALGRPQDLANIDVLEWDRGR